MSTSSDAEDLEDVLEAILRYLTGDPSATLQVTPSETGLFLDGSFFTDAPKDTERIKDALKYARVEWA